MDGTSSLPTLPPSLPPSLMPLIIFMFSSYLPSLPPSLPPFLPSFLVVDEAVPGDLAVEGVSEEGQALWRRREGRRGHR